MRVYSGLGGEVSVMSGILGLGRVRPAGDPLAFPRLKHCPRDLTLLAGEMHGPALITRPSQMTLSLVWGANNPVLGDVPPLVTGSRGDLEHRAGDMMPS